MDYEMLIKALVCATKAPHDERMCDTCPYRLLEEVKPELPVPADVVIDGIGYWRSCKCDQIALDAAKAIKDLLKETEENHDKE